MSTLQQTSSVLMFPFSVLVVGAGFAGESSQRWDEYSAAMMVPCSAVVG